MKAQPLLLPTVTPETKKLNIKDDQNVLQPPMDEPRVKLPKGVVPIPLAPNDTPTDVKIPDDVQRALPNRSV